MSYAKRMLNQQDRPLTGTVAVIPVTPPQFVYQEPYSSNEVRGLCFRLSRKLKEQENHRRVRYDNGRRIEIPLSHEQLRLLPGGTVPGRTRRPKDLT